MVETSVGTCLTRVVCPVRRSVHTEVGRSGVATFSQAWIWRSLSGLQGDRGTAALKPRPAYRWPVREMDVCDVIFKASLGGQEEGGRGGGHCASHQKSPVAMATASEERRRGTAPARSLSLSPKGPLVRMQES